MNQFIYRTVPRLPRLFAIIPALAQMAPARTVVTKLAIGLLIIAVLGPSRLYATAFVEPEGDDGSKLCCTSGVKINEIRATHPPSGGADGQEYFELRGDPGTPLDCMYYLVIGPGGVVEEVESLAGHAIQPDGLLLVAQPTFNPALFPGAGPADLAVPDLNFINNGNRTHLLCCACNGTVPVETDLDQNNDGVLDSMPWDCMLDCIALIQDPLGPPWYCPTYRGPTLAGNAPAHVWRCTLPVFPPAPWRIGPFPLPAGGGDDTPGITNPACAGGGGGGAFGGIALEAVGAATLDMIGGDLLVSNIGSSGLDGVALLPGSADFTCIAFSPEQLGGTCNPDTPPTLTMIPLSIDGVELGRMRVACMADVVGPVINAITAEFANSPLVTVQVFNDGVLVHEERRVAAAAVSVIIISVPCPDPDDEDCIMVFDVWDPAHGGSGDPDGDDEGYGADVPEDSTIEVNAGGAAGGTKVVGDYIAILPSIPSGTANVGEVRVLAENSTGFTLQGAALGAFDNPHMGIGPSLLYSDPIMVDGPLQVHDLGGQTGSEFGVGLRMPYYVETPDGVIIGIIVHPSGLEDAPTGSSLNISSSWLMDGVPLGLGSVDVTNLNDQTMLHYDFGELLPLTSGPIQVQYFLDGQMLGQQPAPGPVFDLVAVAPFALWVYKIEVVGNFLYVRKCFIIDFPSPFGKADEIVICIPVLIDPPKEFPPILLNEWVATEGLAQFAISNEEPIYLKRCPSDLNGDGNTGPADLADLLANWGPCPGCPADITDDGHVGPADLANLLAGWGDCPY